MNAQDVKAKAREIGADLVGIADPSRLDYLAAENNPYSIFPECKSIIVIGRRVLRGSLRGVEEGTNFGSTYNTFGYTWLEDNFLSQTTYDLTCWLEEDGIEAVPIFGYNEEGMPKGLPVEPGKPAPNVYVDMDAAAQAAGLGSVGLCDIFLTPKYGPRQRFAAILTDAELEADAVFEGSICGDCEACVGACPFDAVDSKNTKKVGVAGFETEVATVDYSICNSCPNGAGRAGGRGTRPDRIAALCSRTCMVKLEAAEKVSNRFEQPFRQRTPWALDTFNRPISVDQRAAIATGCDGGTHVSSN